MLSSSFFTLPAESSKKKNTGVKRYFVTQHVTMVMSISKILC